MEGLERRGCRRDEEHGHREGTERRKSGRDNKGWRGKTERRDRYEQK